MIKKKYVKKQKNEKRVKVQQDEKSEVDEELKKNVRKQNKIIF
jgi:hypothetical protein